MTRCPMCLLMPLPPEQRHVVYTPRHQVSCAVCALDAFADVFQGDVQPYVVRLVFRVYPIVLGIN
jgi:hypothetical protein